MSITYPFPNPFILSVPASANFTISCTANSSNNQQVTITDVINGGSNQLDQFSGQGEAVTMYDGNNQSVYNGTATSSGSLLNLYFQYSQYQSDWQNAALPVVTVTNSVVAQADSSLPVISTTYTFGTEDGTDNDCNDTLLTLTVFAGT